MEQIHKTKTLGRVRGGLGEGSVSVRGRNFDQECRKENNLYREFVNRYCDGSSHVRNDYCIKPPLKPPTTLAVIKGCAGLCI
jgi:hypothetical protein